MRLYNKQRVPFLDKHFICEVCNLAPATELHHRKGRGKYLLDESTWLAVCFNCHRTIHDKPALAYATGLLLKRG